MPNLNNFKYLVLLYLLFGTFLSAIAKQPNTNSPIAFIVNKKLYAVTFKRTATEATNDTVYHPDSLHTPHAAVIRSLIIPGLGQLYNRQWWKVPIIYTGLGLLADAVAYNNRYYHEFLALSYYRYFSRTPKSGDKYYTQAQQFAGYTPQQIYDIKDSFRRDRDLSILGFFAAWGLQVIDAYIDAKFRHSYSMDTNLSFRASPVVINQPLYAAQNENGSIIPGIKLTFTFQ